MQQKYASYFFFQYIIYIFPSKMIPYKHVYFIYLFIYHQQSETPTDYILKN
jgi:hypothetical protein